VIVLALHIEREKRPSADTTSTFRLIANFSAVLRQLAAFPRGNPFARWLCVLSRMMRPNLFSRSGSGFNSVLKQRYSDGVRRASLQVLLSGARWL
jgi:hypothetical protein